jgi:hypothetical protein
MPQRSRETKAPTETAGTSKREPFHMNAPEQKCCFKGCTNRGIPQDGFDFFVCDDCFVELEACLEKESDKRLERHANN